MEKKNFSGAGDLKPAQIDWPVFFEIILIPVDEK